MADDLFGPDIGDGQDLGNLESLFDSSYVSIQPIHNTLFPLPELLVNIKHVRRYCETRS